MRIRISAVVLVASLSANLMTSALAQETRPMGLYTCTEPSGYPDMTSMFGLLDASTYSNSEGATGKYSYTASAGLIAMQTGPLAGKSYKRIPGTNTFLMQNRAMALACPHSTRDPRHRPW